MEGVRIFNNFRPHLVFIDRRMPVMDGLSAMNEINKLPGSKNTAIVAITAHAFKNERQEMLDAGCIDFISKPFSTEDIFGVIEKYLNVNIIRSEINPEDNHAATEEIDYEELKALPEILRYEFENALVKLDIKKINDSISQIAEINPKLAEKIEKHSKIFDYKTILNILQNK